MGFYGRTFTISMAFHSLFHMFFPCFSACLHVCRMRFFFYLPLLCSFLALLPYAFEVSDFQFPPPTDLFEDFFPPEESFDDTLARDGTFDDISDSSFLLASDCSAFAPSINRKRLRREDSSGFCSVPPGLTNHESQKNENGHFSTISDDDTIDPNIPIGDLFAIPALATYPNERNNDCFRLTQGQQPLAVCDLGGGKEYFLDGKAYRDLDYSYPSKETHYFPHLPFSSGPYSFWGGEGFQPEPIIPSGY